MYSLCQYTTRHSGQEKTNDQTSASTEASHLGNSSPRTRTRKARGLSLSQMVAPQDEKDVFFFFCSTSLSQNFASCEQSVWYRASSFSPVAKTYWEHGVCIVLTRNWVFVSADIRSIADPRNFWSLRGSKAAAGRWSGRLCAGHMRAFVIIYVMDMRALHCDGHAGWSPVTLIIPLLSDSLDFPMLSDRAGSEWVLAGG